MVKYWVWDATLEPSQTLHDMLFSHMESLIYAIFCTWQKILMCASTVPKEQRPSFCTQSLVLKLLEVVSLLVLELVEVLCLLLLLFIEHCSILEEVLMGGVTTILHEQCTFADTKERKLSFDAMLPVTVNPQRYRGCGGGRKGLGSMGGAGAERQTSLKGAAQMTHLSRYVYITKSLSYASFMCMRIRCNMWPWCVVQHPLLNQVSMLQLCRLTVPLFRHPTILCSPF